MLQALLHAGGDGIDLARGIGGGDSGISSGLLGALLHLLGGLRGPLLELLVGRRRMAASGEPCQRGAYGQSCPSAVLSVGADGIPCKALSVESFASPYRAAMSGQRIFTFVPMESLHSSRVAKLASH